MKYEQIKSMKMRLLVAIRSICLRLIAAWRVCGYVLGLFVFFSQTSAIAQQTVKADYRATPAGKLDAAKHYVAEFLLQDADPKQVFFIRDINFPVWKDQPTKDCIFHGLVRWIEPQEPYFENGKKTIVIIPVIAELLMAEAGGYGNGWGRDQNEDGKSSCKWEYERYNFKSQKFEKLPQFRTRTYNEEFATWGENILLYSTPYQVNLGVIPRLIVSIAPDKRLVRYHLRINVARELPHRLTPQVPRHWYAQDAIKKLELSIERTTLKLIAGVSDREPSASGDELKEDMRRMMLQREEMRWMVTKLREALAQEMKRPFTLQMNNSTNQSKSKGSASQ